MGLPVQRAGTLDRGVAGRGGDFGGWEACGVVRVELPG